MRRRIPVTVALVVASLLIFFASVVRYHEALAAYFDPLPHSCGGG